MKKKKLFPIVPAALVSVLIAAALLLSSAGGAYALTSLPYIEKLVTESTDNQEKFNILEIVPAAGSGSIGYYIGGQEPIADLSYLLSGLASPEARSSAVTDLFNSLTGSNILGADSKTPITSSGFNYKEAKPWESHTGLTALKLKALEETSVTGTFADGSGTGASYDRVVSYSGAGGGSYVQVVNHFVYATGTESGVYYYTPTFTSFKYDPDNPDWEPDSGTAIYENTDKENPDSPTGTYVYIGTMGDGNFGLNIKSTYYTVLADGAPSDKYTSGSYYAVSSDYRQAESDETGYFSLDYYRYVGEGKGHYTFTADGSQTVTVQYDTVYYGISYTNNDWFLKYVFDRLDDAGTGLTASGTALKKLLTVKSATPASVSVSDVQNADLIVLSAGLNTTVTYAGSSNDITGAVETALTAAANAGTPIIVSDSLRSLSGTNIGKAAAAVATNTASSYVASNVYCIHTALASGSFTAAISGDHTGSTDPFYDVWYEINHENFLRQQSDPNEALLAETVSIATCIRYIINYAGQRSVSNKASIRVLDLEPGKPGTDQLSTDTVSSWTGISKGNITIDHYSTYEFIGKIDDLTETYDLIYVGASLNGFNLNTNGTTNYNDDKMDGLIYTNIGDTWTTDSYKLSGLLDRDYVVSSNTTKINANAATRTFRFSGNDLTQGKYQELLDFAAAGYPVVVADKLVADTAGYNAFSFTAQITASGKSALQAKYTAANGTTIPTSATPSYAWYDGQGNAVGTGDSAFSSFPETPGTYTYYCVITLGGVEATSNTATVTVTSPPYTVQEGSGATPGEYQNGTQNYTITVTRTSSADRWGRISYTYTVSEKPAEATVTWGYYYYGWQNYYYTSTGSSVTINNNYYIDNVQITLNGTTQTISLYNKSFSLNTPLSFPKYDSFTVKVASSTSASGVTLTASTNPTTVSSASYAWYKDNTLYSNTKSITATDAGTYYCEVTVGGSTARSNSFTVSGGGFSYAISASGAGAVVTVPAVAASRTADTKTVDCNAYMYKFLSAVAGRSNTFAESEATSSKTTLVQYLNLSKPEIVFSTENGTEKIPTVYTGSDTSSQNMGGRTLSYTFTIKNDTEPDPAATRYTCRLYIDTDADGLYGDTEELKDIIIRDAAGNTVRSGDLKAGVEYTVTREMSDDSVGIIPWKLEVVKVGQTRVHASETNYTRIAPDNESQKTVINILQIMDDSGGLNLKTNTTIKNYLTQVKDFNISISTVTASALSKSSSWGTYATLTDYLNSYDMLILGFNDCYGDLSNAAAQAVVAYIDSGKAVLFTHDATSRCNLPSNSYPISGNSTVDQGDYYWGYYFNTLLRDAVGLDRYGVTSQKYGVTTFRTDIKATNANVTVGGSAINVASGESALTSDQLQALVSAGYSVAYQPVSGGTGKTLVDEVQGVTYMELITQAENSTQKRPTSGGYYYSKDSGNYLTKKVSQVNKGQITTYPFNINQGTLTVDNTHAQYYQLNMNSDDIVVWYCLADGDNSKNADDVYGYLPNDVTNNYYIYSVGNVTYSGAGHSGTVSDDEAKLFINTMIAAYQTSATPPEASFVQDENSTVPVNNVFFVADSDTGSVLGDDTPVYFTVKDPSLGANKTLTAEFDYGSDVTAVDLPIYDSNGSVVNRDSSGKTIDYSLVGGEIYCVYPARNEGIASAIAESGSVALSITATSSLLVSSPSKATVTLRRVGLFPLA